MFATKRHIPRRTFLRGAGVTLALPLLESMLPALTPLRLTAAAPVKRFVGIWHPHGAAPGYWSPLQEGKDFEFSFITKPLPTQVNPRVVFERLFGDGTSAEERRAGRKQNASILDSITSELRHFKKDLGAADQARLDTYVENVRELERRIRIAMAHSVEEPSAEIPFGLPDNKHVHYRLMY